MTITKQVLHGPWDFVYDPDGVAGGPPTVPTSDRFTASMPVPGYWDDHLDRLTDAPFWAHARFSPSMPRPIRFPMGDTPPDADLPHLLGVAWYRYTFQAPEAWLNRCVTLHVGGIVLECWVWLNGIRLGYHLGPATGFHTALEGPLKAGEHNTLLLAVSNLRTDRGGCSLRGHAGCGGGIRGPVALHIAGARRIRDLFVRPGAEAGELLWSLSTARSERVEAEEEDLAIRWHIAEPDSDTVLDSGTVVLEGDESTWTTAVKGLRPWSDRDPSLYAVTARIISDHALHDARTQVFGLREVKRDGIRLRLNDTPLYLRGLTEHHYFPLTCTAPSSVAFYRTYLRALKSLGFNWMRCHTWVPPEPCMQAADELGMLLQVEAPVGAEDSEWIDILNACRLHPSVVLFCGGNEELLDESAIERLGEWARLCRDYAPGQLFSPMEALRGVEYGWHASDLGPDRVEDPYPHNPSRLDRLRGFSDVLESYAWAMLSYHCLRGDSREVDRRLAAYDRPCLSHEIGIHGNYLNLDLEHRYEGTRTGTCLFAATRQLLTEQGLLARAPVYYLRSCAFMRSLRKYTIEQARLCRRLSGYDFLAATDQHWHRWGYPGGILNEFFEMKPGETPQAVRCYNDESVLLLDMGVDRVFLAGAHFSRDAFVSYFGPESLGNVELAWTLVSEHDGVLARGTQACEGVPCGEITPLGHVSFSLPETTRPAKLTLRFRLSGGPCELENAWDIWVFPSVAEPPRAEACPASTELQTSLDDVRVASELTDRDVEALAAGQRVLLLGHAPLPAASMEYQSTPTGRGFGHKGVVLWEHPLLDGFPHDGFADWQCFRMMEDSHAVVFDALPWPFEPIIEFISPFKRAQKLAGIFELAVGTGRLLVCSLCLRPDDPAGAWLSDRLMRYVQGPRFEPRDRIDPESLARVVSAGAGAESLHDTDEGFDANAAAH